MNPQLQLISHKPVPFELRTHNQDWFTYVPMLYEAVCQTEGLIVELGIGVCSTPLIAALGMGRQIYSLEDNAEWYSTLRSYYEDELHRFWHITDWRKQVAQLVALKPALVFVDCGGLGTNFPQLRLDLIRLFQDSAEVIVVHDLQFLGGVEKIPHFKIMEIDSHQTNSTLWLSNSTAPQYTVTRRERI